MSAAVAKNGQLVWTHGFGFADVENRIPADLTLLRWAMARLQAAFDGWIFTLIFLKTTALLESVINTHAYSDGDNQTPIIPA